MTSRHDVTSRCKEGVKRNLAGLLNSTSFFLHLRFNQKWRHSEFRFGFFLPWSDVINFVCKKEWRKGLTKLNFRDVRDNCFGVSGSVDHCDTQEDQFPVATVVMWAAIVPNKFNTKIVQTQFINRSVFSIQNSEANSLVKKGAKGDKYLDINRYQKQTKRFDNF